ncbi:uncharacterized protein EI90DRAFT_2593193 [Cantharellus anzutake]|uniref:uncharacterized protein n=1 Tax=Cantharellus anzutake TaxID=1750568 RepID=UPI001904DE01|nr:uncharacterized protein EI90DRAFT_2593193 [Cantharellus anzutake]KAF8321040.1 hypothetical protein EI90DRAFT_2593193 [Cantharellus anzutake]
MSSKTSGSVPAPLRIALPSSTPAISTPSESSTRAPSPVSDFSVFTKPGEPEELKIVEVKGLEEGHYWDGHQDDEIPDKTHGRIFRNLRYQIFTLYRRLFSIVIITNMIIFIVSMANGGLVAGQIGQLVHGNLLVAIVMRQDHVINAFFLIFCAVPLSYVLVVRVRHSDILTFI